MGPQLISYQSASPSHNQNLPRADAQASSLSFPQRLAKGLGTKLQMTRNSSACLTQSQSPRDSSPARPQRRTLKEGVPGNSGRAALMIKGQEGTQRPDTLGAPSGYPMVNLQRPSTPSSSQMWQAETQGSESGVKLRSSYSNAFSSPSCLPNPREARPER